MKAVFETAKVIIDGENSFLCLGVPYREAMKFCKGMKPKKYVAEIKEYRERRSLDANAYFHVLVGKIAEEMNMGFEEVKTNLVTEYGTFERDETGAKVGFKLPASVDVSRIYRYVKCFDTREENGMMFNCYIVFKHTHLMDSKEMNRLIDGTVYEAKNLGIETLPPEKISALLGSWRCE